MGYCAMYDYDHAPVWCPACWEDARRAREVTLQEQHLVELKRYNDLREWELEQGGRPRPRYVPPPPPAPAREPQKPAIKGGISIEPRRAPR